MKEHIVVLGWYGKHNIGDESYKQSFPALFPGFDFTFTDDLRKAPADYNYLIMGGGNVIDNTFFNQLEQVTVPKLLLSVGLPAQDDAPTNALIAKMRMFTHICVRDYITHEFLSSKGLEVNYLPDYAFALRADKVRGRQLIKQVFKQEDCELYNNVVGVCLNGFLVGGSDLLARDYLTFQKVAWDVARCADNTNASFLFIPFGGDQFSNDRTPNAWAAVRCKWYRKNCVIWDRLSVQDTLDIIAACDTVVSTRLHASIFSTIAGVPFVDLTHHDKNRVYLESIAKRDWSLDYWSLDPQKLHSLVNSHMPNKSARRELLVMAAINRQTLMSNVPRFLDPSKPIIIHKEALNVQNQKQLVPESSQVPVP